MEVISVPWHRAGRFPTTIRGLCLMRRSDWTPNDTGAWAEEGDTWCKRLLS